MVPLESDRKPEPHTEGTLRMSDWPWAGSRLAFLVTL